MLKDIKNIGFNGIVYIIAALLSKGLNIVLLPVYTRFLTVEEYGAVSLLLLYKNITITFLGLGQLITVKKNFYDYQVNGKDYKSFFSTILIGTTIVEVFLTGLFFVFGQEIFDLFFEGISFSSLGMYVLLACFLLVPYQLLLKLYQTRNESIKFAKFEIFYMSMDSIISLLLIIVFSFGPEGRAVGILGSTILIFILSIPFIRKEINFSFDFRLYKSNLKVGLPTIPHYLSGFVLNMSDRIFLNKVYDLTTVGVYSLGYQLAQVIDIVSLSIIESWSSYFMKYASSGEEESKKFIAKFSLFYLGFILFCSMLVIIFSKEILFLFFGEEYNGALWVIPLVVLAFAFKNIYYISNQQLIYTGKTNMLFVSTGIAAGLNLLLNYLLIIILDLGMVGAGITASISMLVMSLLSLFNGQKSFYIPYFKKETVALYVTFIITVILIYGIYHLDSRVELILKICLLIIYFYLTIRFIFQGNVRESISFILKLMKKKGRE